MSKKGDGMAEAPGMEEPFDYVAGYDRMWQAQHDATEALLRTVAERDELAARVEALEAQRDEALRALEGDWLHEDVERAIRILSGDGGSA